MPLRGSNQFVVAEQLASVLSAQPVPESSVEECEGEVEPLLSAAGDAGGRTRAKPLWPLVLWGLVVPLLVLDLLLRRVALGRRRVLA